MRKLLVCFFYTFSNLAAATTLTSQPPQSLSTMPKPWVIAHRGSALLYPENSLEAFISSVKDGTPVVEMDVYALADGALGIMHDNTVNRTTNMIGNTASFTGSTWRSLQIDSPRILQASYLKAAPPFLNEAIAVVVPSSIIMPEAKNTKSGQAITTQLLSLGVPLNQAIVQSFSLAELKAPIKEGYEGLYLVNKLSSITNWGDIVKAGVKYIGYGVSDVDDKRNIAAAHALGLNVIRWTINRRSQALVETQAGADGYMTDDFVYLNRNTPMSNIDTWHTGKWMPGMLPSGSRGMMFGNGQWGYLNTDSGYQGALQGWGCPTGKSFLLEYDVAVTALNSQNDMTRWASAFVAADDDNVFKDAIGDKVTGYHLILRANGSLEVWRKDFGQAIKLIGQSKGKALKLGAFVRLVVYVTPSSISFTRAGSSQSVTVKDTKYRGQYFHLGRNGVAARFRNVRVLPF